MVKFTNLSQTRRGLAVSLGCSPIIKVSKTHQTKDDCLLLAGGEHEANQCISGGYD